LVSDCHRCAIAALDPAGQELGEYLNVYDSPEGAIAVGVRAKIFIRTVWILATADLGAGVCEGG